MSKNFDSYNKRRLASSYISVVISIALVLFMVGVLALVMLKSNMAANQLKEKVAITLFLKDNLTKDQINGFQKYLSEQSYTKNVVYVSKEEAAEKYSAEIGEDFLSFLGSNPLKNGIDLYLKAEAVTPIQMEMLEQQFLNNLFVADVSYDKPLINLLTKNINRVSYWLLLLSGFFSVIAILLINSSIRLAIYAKRFNIKTMQMVGATKSFIRRPFIMRSIKLGLIGALVAIIGLGIFIYYINSYVPSLQLLEDYLSLLYITGSIFAGALLITWLSTFFATQRFLNLQTDELYY
jgi:cell division transport system permease protein